MKTLKQVAEACIQHPACVTVEFMVFVQMRPLERAEIFSASTSKREKQKGRPAGEGVLVSTGVSHVRSVEAGRSGGGHAKEESSQEARGKEDVVLDELLALLDDSWQLAVGPPGKLILGLLHVLV